MNLSGTKHAVDIQGDYKYTLTFKNASLTDLHTYDKTGGEVFIKDQARKIVLTDPVDNQYLVLEIFFNTNGRVYSAEITGYIDKNDPKAPLPEQPEPQQSIFENNIARLDRILKKRKPGP